MASWLSTRGVEASLLTEEEQELELQYGEQRIYAVGHGAAANWDVEQDRTARIWSEFMPESEVPMMTVNPGDDDAVLDLEYFDDAPLCDDLQRFVDAYADWIAEQKHISTDFPKEDQQVTSDRICVNMQIALDRMRECIEMLRTDRPAYDSFRFAYRAMLDQMRQAVLVDGKETKPAEYRWRPFQLAFLLTVMVSTIREDHEF